jgi:predicted nuclease of restriction endonuclease-like RecB superfamily
MTVFAGRDFKTILRYAKLARLMHTIARRDNNYIFRFNGPASIVRETRRYGVAMARFLPGLLAADDWRMRAIVIGPLRRRFALQLSSRDGLRGEITPGDFDSELEETFHRRWQSADTQGWTIDREATVLHAGQSVFMPDFTFRHPEHGEVLLEIIGFWTPEYLRDKAKRLAQFRSHGRILLAVAEHADEAIPDLGLPRVVYKTKLLPKAVLDLLTQCTPPNGC